MRQPKHLVVSTCLLQEFLTLDKFSTPNFHSTGIANVILVGYPGRKNPSYSTAFQEDGCHRA